MGEGGGVVGCGVGGSAQNVGPDPEDPGAAMVGRLVDCVEVAYGRASTEGVEVASPKPHLPPTHPTPLHPPHRRWACPIEPLPQPPPCRPWLNTSTRTHTRTRACPCRLAPSREHRPARWPLQARIQVNATTAGGRSNRRVESNSMHPRCGRRLPSSRALSR
jgi:hypothetical protein